MTSDKGQAAVAVAVAVAACFDSACRPAGRLAMTVGTLRDCHAPFHSARNDSWYAPPAWPAGRLAMTDAVEKLAGETVITM